MKLWPFVLMYVLILIDIATNLMWTARIYRAVLFGAE